MPLEAQDRLGHNWHIRANVIKALRRHESEGGMGDVLHIYIGETERIDEVVSAFEVSSSDENTASTHIYARLSCINGLSGKYHIVSLYQTERLVSGSKNRTLQATWIPKARMPLTSVVDTLQESFGKLAHSNPKYGGKLPEIVGSLHEFK